MLSTKPFPKFCAEIIVQSSLWDNTLLTLLDELTIQLPRYLNWPRCPDELQFTVTFTDNQAITQLNQQYRGYDRPTNVLSFPAFQLEPDNWDNLLINDGEAFIGDIFLAYEYITAESQRLGKLPHHHLTHLILHGLLHLLGYDHIEDNSATIMENLEISVLANLDIPNPYQ